MNTKVLHRRVLFAVAVGAGIVTAGNAAQAGSIGGVDCPVTHQTFKLALQQAAAADATGFDNNYWGVVVNRAGVVCAVAFSGPEVDAQWLLSRQIAAAKAFTANGLSLDGAPISSGQLYASVQPGAAPNPLFGLHFGNPLDPEPAYKGNAQRFGTPSDPMVGERVGGTISFGGGFGLYSGANAVGGVGLSGDTACADHSTAWRLRALLGLVPGAGDDRITLDNALDDFGDHPRCPNDAGTQGAVIPPST